jgi:hypothetical protein
MGEACSAHGKDEMYEGLQKCSEKFWREVTTWEIWAQMEDNIKMGHEEIGREDADWIPLTQDTDQCRAVVNTVMNLRIP